MVLTLKRRIPPPLLSHITPFNGKTPKFDHSVFIDPTARLIGEVILGAGVSIWPHALLRADSGPLVVGERSVFLDKVLVESPKGYPVTIEKKVLVSHGAILHGCTVREGAVIGIGAIVLERAEVGRHSIVGSGSLVPPNTKVPENSVVVGIPARVVRTLDEADRKKSEEQLAEIYAKSRAYLRIFGSPSARGRR